MSVRRSSPGEAFGRGGWHIERPRPQLVPADAEPMLGGLTLADVECRFVSEGYPWECWGHYSGLSYTTPVMSDDPATQCMCCARRWAWLWLKRAANQQRIESVTQKLGGL